MTRSLRFLLIMAVAALAPSIAMAQTIEPAGPDDRSVGVATAPVTLTVYLSTTCGHCAAWHANDLPAIKAKYVDTGQVRIVYRDYPTPPVPFALAGAQMARCVPTASYDATLEALFAGQTALRAGPYPQAAQRWLVQGGVAGGLTIDQMNACMTDPANRAAIEARVMKASEQGVEFTPAFYVDGKPVLAESPTHDVAAFDAVLQPLLAGR